MTNHSRAKIHDDPDWLVTNHQTGFDGVLPAHDMEIRSTNGCQGDANHRLVGPSLRDRNFPYAEIIFAAEYVRSHCFHGFPLPSMVRYS